MDVTGNTKILLNRIQDLELGNATKIIGYLLLKHSHQEIMEYAFGTDTKILGLINEAKAYLLSSLNPMHALTDQPMLSYWEPHPSADQQPLVNNFDLVPPYADAIGDFHRHGEFISFGEQLNWPNSSGNDHHPEAAPGGGLGLRSTLRIYPGLQEVPVKPCHFFNMGYCRNGTSCTFSHGQIMPDGLSYNHIINFNESSNEDQAIQPGSVEKLEMEITELLKSRRGLPVSVAALPLLYLEKHGKLLQPEEYLSNRQWHVKASFNWIRLLAQMKNIWFTDRPYGELAMILAEEAPNYLGSDLGESLDRSFQIYITFRPESKFTAEDVVNYFSKYGPVYDVQIPGREKRMFGFVSFYHPETAQLILEMGQPHLICGYWVLAKRCVEKSKLTDRMDAEKMGLPGYYHSLEMQLDMNAVSKVSHGYSPLKKQLIEEHEYYIELERRRLLKLQLLLERPMPQPGTY
ncbi:zinc finger CCCH domain-containing protein 18 [Cocos nucifera]|uniref:Zinc finger CCCH domain-containing protein 18 n=1 Tax=Cocos nucifera TaxID=13894 RepID=A0A8K0ITK3_COCNU|nr:zinc finger CCCH domain-containing protein 18 [Cocos nucifera]